MSMPLVEIQWTAATLDEAKSVARFLLAQNMVACVNMVPNVISVFEWEGVVEEAEEVLVLCKTTAATADRVVSTISQRSSYDVAAVCVLPIISGAEKYVAWVTKSVEALQ